MCAVCRSDVVVLDDALLPLIDDDAATGAGATTAAAARVRVHQVRIPPRAWAHGGLEDYSGVRRAAGRAEVHYAARSRRLSRSA